MEPDRRSRQFIGARELRKGVRRLASEISLDHPDGVLLVVVLKGALPFAADLIRAVSVPSEIDFLSISAYVPDSGRVRLVKDLDRDIAGRPVVLVEDIVDTGLTLGYLLGEMGRRDPLSLRVCTLIDKPARRILPTPIDYCGFTSPDEFILGYGLDFAGRYRNLDRLVLGELEVLTRDPDAYVDDLYTHYHPGDDRDGARRGARRDAQQHTDRAAP